MIKFALNSDSIKNRNSVVTINLSYVKTDWLSPEAGQESGPTTYEAESPANYRQEAHFHLNDEFQFVTHGSGMLESESISVGTIIYAKRFTAYGPLQAGDSGLNIMTIRMVVENTSQFITDYADQIKDQVQIKKIIQPIDRGDCSTLTEVEVFKDLIDGAPGALTGIIRIPPDFDLDNIQEMFPGDKFIFVKTGSIYTAGVELTQWDHVFLSAGETIFQIKTGSAGAELIIMQFTQ